MDRLNYSHGPTASVQLGPVAGLYVGALSRGGCLGERFCQARESKSGVPMFIGWMVAWLMVGVGVGVLVNNKRVVAFLSATAAFALLVVVGFLLAR